jgi:hypothetical protein
MRRFLFALLAASLPVAADAATFAEYYPASGDVIFKETSVGFQLLLISASGRLNAASSVQVEANPSTAVVPPGGFTPTGAAWFLTSGDFAFDTLTARGLVQPFTPVSDLTALFHFRSSTRPLRIPIVSIPEPSTIALAACGLFGVLAIKRRRAGPLANRRGE